MPDLSAPSTVSTTPVSLAPILTVLVPTRNRWGLLAAQVRAVHAVLDETGLSYEIIIHDNSTQPPPAGLVEALPPTARYVRSPQDFDTAEENICEAWRHCGGEYVWLLADDDGVEPEGVSELVRLLRRGEQDIIVFNSRHGRDERLAGDEAYVTERARRFFYEKEMACTIGDFVQRTGFFYWLCAISTVVVRRSAAPVEPLRKYLGIARIYAHVAWLIEIGKDRRFLFVNRPLVVYGLSPNDHDGGQGRRSVGVREGGYSNSVWTGLWLRVLDELVAQGALTLAQIRRTAEMNHTTRFHFGSNLAHQVLEQLGDLPELPPPEDLALIRHWLLLLFPGAIFLAALVDEVVDFTATHGAGLLRIEQDPRRGQTVRTLSHDLRLRVDWWRRAIGSTPWYARFYVETLHLYDIYDFGDDWVAAHTSFGGLREALEVIDLPSIPPAFLRAASYTDLREAVEAQPLELETLKGLRSAALSLPNEWGRLGTEAAGAHVHVAPSPVTVIAPGPPSAPVHEELAWFKAELARQDAQLADVYASTSWRLTAGFRWLAGRRRVTTIVDAPTLEPGVELQLGEESASAYVPRGFASPEPWGRWTTGRTAIFRCRHLAREAPAVLTFTPKMVWPPEGRPCEMSLAVNRQRARRLTVRAGEPIRIELAAADMSQPLLEVVFTLHAPKSPDEQPRSDIRRLGVGLACVQLAWRDPG